MCLIKNIKKRIIYKFTKKPECYVHIDKPKTWQDKRQVQYNNWCKAKGVYNGSYLPKNPDTLKRKGWNETTNPKNKTNKEYQRKSTGQMVRYDFRKIEDGIVKPEHYHWKNATSVSGWRKQNKETKYIDRYGSPCSRKSGRHHLAPLDKDFK
jgi:hypothetical protein